jgi:hypothetical protein
MHAQAGRWCSILIWQTALPDSAPPSEAHQGSSRDDVHQREPEDGGRFEGGGFSQQKFDWMNRLRCDLSPNTFMCEHFEQNGMRNSPVDDMGFADTVPERIQAGMDLGQHPFPDRPLLHHPLHVFA